MPGEENLVLERDWNQRPAARYNRPGQDALYLTQNEESARAALLRYVTAESRHRILVRYLVGNCRVLDLRAPAAQDLAERAKKKWDDFLAQGREPPSWSVSDWAREQGCDGLIDPSRQMPDLWHLTLFRWNDGVGASVQVDAEPLPVVMALQSE